MIMERKIGEIFDYKGEWYQCIGNPYNECTDCDFCFETGKACVRQIVGQCSMSNRSDGLSVVFKRLEKVGEPYTAFVDKTVQNYLLETAVTVPPKDVFTLINNEQRLIAIEIKQNKECMEENKLNLKPFDIQKAKAGKPVCTRDGRKARIICLDRIDSTGCNLPIVALVQCEETEVLQLYHDDGKCDVKADLDLMMLPEKKVGSVNVYKERCYETKEEAIRHIAPGTHYIDTIRVEWEDKE